MADKDDSTSVGGIPGCFTIRPRYISIEEVKPPLDDINAFVDMFDASIIAMIQQNLIIADDFLRRFDDEVQRRIESAIYRSSKLLEDHEADTEKRIRSALEWVYDRMPRLGIDPGDPDEMEKVVVDHPGLLKVTIDPDCKVQVTANLCQPSQPDIGMVADIADEPDQQAIIDAIKKSFPKGIGKLPDNQNRNILLQNLIPGNVSEMLFPDWLRKLLEVLSPTAQFMKTLTDAIIKVGSMEDIIDRINKELDS